MAEVYVKCNLCGSDENRVVLKIDGRTYVACSKCGLVFRNPIPSDEVVHEFYRENASSDVRVEIQRMELYRNFLEKLGKLKPKAGRLLDVGCGYGRFLRVLGKTCGFQPELIFQKKCFKIVFETDPLSN